MVIFSRPLTAKPWIQTGEQPIRPALISLGSWSTEEIPTSPVDQPETSTSFWKLSPQFGSLRGATSHPAATIPLRSKSLVPTLNAVAEMQGGLGQVPWVVLSPGASTGEQGQGSLWTTGGVAQVP